MGKNKLGKGPLSLDPAKPPAITPQKLRITIRHYDGQTGKDMTETIEGEGIGVDHMLSNGPSLFIVKEVLKNAKGDDCGQEYALFTKTFVKSMRVEVL